MIVVEIIVPRRGRVVGLGVARDGLSFRWSFVNGVAVVAGGASFVPLLSSCRGR